MAQGRTPKAAGALSQLPWLQCEAGPGEEGGRGDGGLSGRECSLDDWSFIEVLTITETINTIRSSLTIAPAHTEARRPWLGFEHPRMPTHGNPRMPTHGNASNITRPQQRCLNAGKEIPAVSQEQRREGGGRAGGKRGKRYPSARACPLWVGTGTLASAPGCHARLCSRCGQTAWRSLRGRAAMPGHRYVGYEGQYSKKSSAPDTLWWELGGGTS